jgi:hypothetical protein
MLVTFRLMRVNPETSRPVVAIAPHLPGRLSSAMLDRGMKSR